MKRSDGTVTMFRRIPEDNFIDLSINQLTRDQVGEFIGLLEDLTSITSEDLDEAISHTKP